MNSNKIAQATLKRPDAMTPEAEQRILDGVASGRTLAEVCADPGMPSPSTVYRTLRADAAFADTFALAERQFADEKFREISAIVAKVQAGKVDPASARVAIDALRCAGNARGSPRNTTTASRSQARKALRCCRHRARSATSNWPAVPQVSSSAPARKPACPRPCSAMTMGTSRSAPSGC
jgi:hypothetical protein